MFNNTVASYIYVHSVHVASYMVSLYIHMYLLLTTSTCSRRHRNWGAMVHTLFDVLRIHSFQEITTNY